MSIETPGLTLNIPESYSTSFEHEPGGNDAFGGSSMKELEDELEHEIKELDHLLEKMLEFEEKEITQQMNQDPPSGFGSGAYGKGRGQGRRGMPQGTRDFTPGHGRGTPNSEPGWLPPDTNFTEGASNNGPGKVEKSSATNANGTPATMPAVKGQYTDADLGKLPPSLEDFRTDILDAANKSGVPPNILAAQIYQESRGRIDAGSTNQGTGMTDAGLMQVDPATFEALRKEHPDLGPNLSDPATNILAGAYYDEDMSKQFGGSIPLMLRAYNSGPNGVDKNDPNAIPAGVGDPNYVKLVMQYADDIQTGKPLPA